MFTWREKLGKPECPYLVRWVAAIYYSLRLHHWLAGDDPRAFHDHPWWYVTFCIWGGYTDVSPAGEVEVGRWSFHYFPAAHRHTVRVNPGGAWTLLLTGPEKREWGFWVAGKFRKRNKYFFEWGHHPCEQSRVESC